MRGVGEGSTPTTAPLEVSVGVDSTVLVLLSATDP
jgi:hypothetical protein